jgi:hypothetical protein
MQSLEGLLNFTKIVFVTNAKVAKVPKVVFLVQ